MELSRLEWYCLSEKKAARVFGIGISIAVF